MKVEVDTADINNLEQRIDELSALLTTLVSKRKGGTITITEVASGSVTVEQTDDGMVLTYKPADQGNL